MAWVLLIYPETEFSKEEARLLPRLFQQADFGTHVASGPAGPKGMNHLEEVRPRDYVAVIFVGGHGARQYWDDPRALAIAREAHGAGAIVGASRQAVVVLARAGLLGGRRATTLASQADEVERAGGRYTGAEVEVDDGVVTLRNSRRVFRFARTIRDLAAQVLAV